jgi:FAD/FMN-containing dehydrogenase
MIVKKYLKVKIKNGGEMSNSEIVNQLRAEIRGDVLLPDSSAYDEARTVWNGMIDKRPSIIVRCLGVADVVACVNFAREQGHTLSIKGGGHNISGLAVSDDGLMIDMSLMRGVWVDPEKRVAHAQAGCLLGDVDRETQSHGLAAVLGFVSETGIGGLTLGGGFGYLSKKYGWTSDTVLSMQVVTADGRVIRASENENSDLFWALRGGGGNFGVVTDFEYKLFPVGPEVIAGAIAWPAEYSKEVFNLYQSISENAPPELVCVAGLRIAPPAPWLSKDIHGKPIVALFVCHTGDVEEGEKLVAPIKALGSPVGDILQKRPYVSQQSLLDATQPKGRRYYWKSEYMPKLDPEALTVASEHAKTIVSPHSAILFFPLHGALNKLPPEHSPVGNRDAAWVFNVSSSWENASEDQANIAWTRKAWEEMLQFSTGGTYINFLTEDEGDERIRAAYGMNYDRLIEAKNKWDPKNLFHINKNIAPKM